MGAYRSVPLVDKASNDGEGNGVVYGVSEMQGWRVTMEVSLVKRPATFGSNKNVCSN